MQITLKKMNCIEIKKTQFIQNEKVAPKQTIECYLQALRYSNLILNEQLEIRNVKIYKDDHVHEIYINCHPQKDLPHLVMLHGFGGIALTFIRTFQLLKDHYQIHALDTFGIGLSSIGNYSEQLTIQQAKHYFVDAIQQWRKALHIQTFTMAGHSFGGYISTLYSQKYPHCINRLILLSPAGTTSMNKEQIDAQVQRRRNNSLGSKIFFCLGQKIYNINVRPSSLISSCLIGNIVLERLTSVRLKLKDNEKQAWKKYLRSLCKRTESSQTGFYKLFQWPVHPSISIQQIVKNSKFKFPIEFYYGDTDWMDRKGADKLKKTQKNVICEIIQDAGHQLIFDNPTGTVQKILRIGRIDQYNSKIHIIFDQQDQI